MTSRFHQPSAALGCSQFRGRVLDRPAQPLPLGVGDAQQLLATDVTRSFLRGWPGTSGSAPARIVHRPCASSWPPTSSAARSPRVRRRRRSRPDGDADAPETTLDLVPMADGGEGTMDALVDALPGGSCRQPCPARSATRSRPRSGSRRRPRGARGGRDGARFGTRSSRRPRRDPLRRQHPRHRRADRAALDRGRRRSPGRRASAAARRTTAESGMASALGARFLDDDGHGDRRTGEPRSPRSRGSICPALASRSRAGLGHGRVRRGQPAHRPSGCERGLRAAEGRVARRRRRARPRARRIWRPSSSATSAWTCATSPAPARRAGWASGSWRSAARGSVRGCRS